MFIYVINSWLPKQNFYVYIQTYDNVCIHIQYIFIYYIPLFLVKSIYMTIYIYMGSCICVCAPELHLYLFREEFSTRCDKTSLHKLALNSQRFSTARCPTPRTFCFTPSAPYSTCSNQIQQEHVEHIEGVMFALGSLHAKKSMSIHPIISCGTHNAINRCHQM